MRGLALSESAAVLRSCSVAADLLRRPYKSPILSHVNFLANDGDQLIDDVISLWGTFRYRLNEEELSYLRFIGRRYAVTELFIDVFEVPKPLRDDGLYSLPCADEEMMLEILIGLIGPGQAA